MGRFAPTNLDLDGKVILVTGGTVATLGNAALALAGNAPLITTGAEAALLVDAGSTLNLNAALVYSGNVTKGLAGTLNINTRQFFNTSTGNYFTIAGGTVVLNGGTNTLWQGVQGGNNGQYLDIAPGATLDLNGNSQLIGLLRSPNNSAGQGAGGVITSATPATLVYATQNGDNWGGNISGQISFNKTGSQPINFYSPNTYSGSTLVNYGGLNLTDFATLPNTSSIDLNYATLTLTNGGQAFLNNRINDSAPITLRGGNLTITGRDNTAVVETLGNITLAQGENFFTISNAGNGVRSLEIQAGTLTVQNDATMYSNSVGALGSSTRLKFINGSALLVNGILPFATNAGELLSYDTQLGVAALNTVGFRGYDASVLPTTGVATQNIRLSSGSFAIADVGIPTRAGTYTLNAIAFNVTASGQTISFADSLDTLNLTSGALVINGNGFTRSLGGTLGNGRLTAGGTLSSGTANFYLTSNFSTTTINSAIVDNGYGAQTRLVYTPFNSAVLLLSNANSYTGGTVLNGNAGQTGAIQLGLANPNGSTFAIPAGDLILNYATVSALGPKQIAPTVSPTLNGGGILNLNTYDTTLAGLTFNNNGGPGPAVNLGGGLTSVTGALTSGSSTATLSSTAGLVAGMPFDNPNLPAGTTITEEQPARATIAAVEHGHARHCRGVRSGAARHREAG